MSNRYEWSLRILGLHHGATEAEIREAYRDLVAVWHPDKFAGNERLRRKAETMLKDINNAKDYLDGKNFDEQWQEPEAPNPSGSSEREQDYESETETESEPEREAESEAEDEAETPPTPPSEGNISWEYESKDKAKPNRVVPFLSWGAAIVICLGLLGWLGIKNGVFGPDLSSKGNELQSFDSGPVTDEEVLRALREPEAQDLNLEEAKAIIARATPEQLLRLRNSTSETAQEDLEALTADQKEALEAERDFSPEISEVNSETGTEQSSTGNIFLDELAFQEGLEEPPKGFFTIGSSKDRVKSVQGVPTRISGDTWNYEYSSIEFLDDSVTGYSDISKNLRVTLKPKIRPRNPPKRFGIGSTMNEVLLVQGTPTRISSQSWDYEYSTVEFENLKVKGYSDISNNLLVK